MLNVLEINKLAILAELEEIQNHPDFIIGNPIENLVDTMSRGYAVDSIYYKGQELRVWFEKGRLIIGQDTTLYSLRTQN